MSEDPVREPFAVRLRRELRPRLRRVPAVILISLGGSVASRAFPAAPWAGFVAGAVGTFLAICVVLAVFDREQ